MRQDLMFISVAAQLVTSIRNGAYSIRIQLRNAPGNEECALHAVLPEAIQQMRQTVFHPCPAEPLDVTLGYVDARVKNAPVKLRVQIDGDHGCTCIALRPEKCSAQHAVTSCAAKKCCAMSRHVLHQTSRFSARYAQKRSNMTDRPAVPAICG